MEDAFAKNLMYQNQNKICLYTSLFLLTSDLCDCKKKFAVASWKFSGLDLIGELLYLFKGQKSTYLKSEGLLLGICSIYFHIVKIRHY
jgi:hypothetical protein